MTSRRLHYLVSIFGLIFILATTITGLLWAYAPYLYWDDTYLKKKVDLNTSLEPTEIRPPIELFNERHDLDNVNLKSLSYRTTGGISIVELCTSPKNSAKESCELLNAHSGERISPLPQEIASKIAKEYAPKASTLLSSNFIENWQHRKEGIKPAVWLFKYDDTRETEIIIDANNGRILEEQDTYRQFHFFIMKLHQFNFFGTHKELVILSGLPLLLLMFSGTKLIFTRLKLTKNLNKTLKPPKA